MCGFAPRYSSARKVVLRVLKFDHGWCSVGVNLSHWSRTLADDGVLVSWVLRPTGSPFGMEGLVDGVGVIFRLLKLLWCRHQWFFGEHVC